ncbi:helix-turn-helix domain-containing protein [Muriicola sp. SD30]|uniref:AlbA family DNA-binding domain-containing protein n=1 Tax=Muriicola sp. SD30 TaxID=3240936 RepID=UPI00350F603A
MNWDLDKIRKMIVDKIEENLNLDYKAAASLHRSDTKTKEIAKDVSAFANSDGGTIIYGVMEDPEKRHLPKAIDPIDRMEISKEWLEQIIQGNIRPRIHDILIHPITLDEGLNQVIYVVDIPRSNTAHQAKDRKYYKRFNFNSEAMYDYEIRDVMNRSKDARIELEFEIITKKVEVMRAKPSIINPMVIMGDSGEKTYKKRYKTVVALKVWAVNQGKVLGHYLNAHVEIPYKYLKKNEGKTIEIAKFFMDNTIRDVVDVEFVPSFTGSDAVEKFGPSRYDPILPTRYLLLKKIGLNNTVLESTENIRWVVYCDNAEPREGSVRLADIKVIEQE